MVACGAADTAGMFSSLDPHPAENTATMITAFNDWFLKSQEIKVVRLPPLGSHDPSQSLRRSGAHSEP
jgi:hypothetical protein